MHVAGSFEHYIISSHWPHCYVMSITAEREWVNLIGAQLLINDGAIWRSSIECYAALFSIFMHANLRKYFTYKQITIFDLIENGSFI